MKQDQIGAAILAAFQGEKKKMIIGIAIAILILVIAIVIVFKYKDIKNLILDKAANQKLVDEANTTIKVEDISITQDQFHTYAQKLYKAMNGAGTDEKAIYEVFEAMNSRSDVQQLIKTFGVKDGENLAEWLYDDLSAGDIEHINAILATKSINYQF